MCYGHGSHVMSFLSSTEVGQAITLQQTVMMTTSLVLLGWAIALKIKIYYGSDKVNKLTFKPFNAAICALSLRLVSFIVGMFSVAREICSAVECNLSRDEALQSVLQPSFVFVSWAITNFSSWFCYLVFVIMIA